jgi:diguanylate cyclase (GGDEF)-like protein/PAS domain S-box-containing protein
MVKTAMSASAQTIKGKIDKPGEENRLNQLRREYERRVKMLEQRLQSLIEVTSDFYWETDTAHHLTLLQGPIFSNAGVDPHQLIGKTRWELPSVVPVSADGSWDKHKATLEARKPFADFVYKYLTLQGELRYISSNGQPAFDEDGRFLGYRGISKDVTRRIQIERRMAVEQNVARILAEATSVTEAAERILRAVCETLGWACGAHWVLNEEARTLKSAETWGIAAPGIQEFLAVTRSIAPLPITGDGLVRHTCASAEPRWIRNVTKETSFLRAPHAATAKLRSAFAFPIKEGTKVIGAMEFFSRDTAHEADSELLAGAASLGESIGQFFQRKRTEEDLLRFQTVMDASPDLIFFVDPESLRFLYVNEANSRLSGYSRDEYKTMTAPQAGGVDPAGVRRIYDEVIAKGGETHSSEMMYKAKDGLPGWFEVHRRAVRMGDRWIIVNMSREITSRKLTEKKAVWLSRMYAALGSTNEAILHAKSSQELYQHVCDAAVNGGKFLTTAVLLPESDGTRMRIAAVSGAAAESLRDAPISIDETLAEGRGLVGTAFRTGKPCVSNDFLKDERMQPWHAQADEAGVKAGAAVPLMHGSRTIGVLLLYSGSKRAFNDEAVTLLERMAENIAFALDNFDHEAERKRAEERIQYLATHDGLTGLPNRVMFSQLLNGAIQSARRYQRKFGVLFIDLDRFKVINDTLGHEAGDKLLQETADRLRQSLRSSDTVARLGGDEFVVLVQEVADAEQAATVARKVLSTVIRPMMLAGQECRVTASIGIAMYPGDGEDEQSLMKNADIAMYHAKEEGKNNFQFHSIEIKSQSLERLTLETNLRRALERSEFSLHYQAKLDLKTDTINGVEALLRWQNPQLGSIPPVQFIPLAEETGLIVSIGKWVLRTACAQNVAWQRQGLPPICMAVNLSARQFSDENLLDDIAAALKDSGMAPQLLELEITEGMVIHNPKRAVETLTAIKRMGVRLAIDDFGTGYSSLGQLKNFPIDTLKVDRSFIREIPTDAEDKAITQAIIAMGKTLSLTVVAEGVETEAQAQFLRENACDEMQGYYFSRPIAPDQFATLLRNHVSSPSAAGLKHPALPAYANIPASQ